MMAALKEAARRWRRWRMVRRVSLGVKDQIRHVMRRPMDVPSTLAWVDGDGFLVVVVALGCGQLAVDALAERENEAEGFLRSIGRWESSQAKAREDEIERRGSTRLRASALPFQSGGSLN